MSGSKGSPVQFDQFKDSAEIQKAIEDGIREANIGRLSIIITGRSGVGKSTLVNRIFQGRIAATGQGRPVTKHIMKRSRKDVPVVIYDTPGLELGAIDHDELQDLLDDQEWEADASRQIHVAWICVSEDGRRVEKAETELHEILADYNIPVLGVITKARSDDGFRATVRRLLPKAKNVVRVRALPERFDDSGVELPPMGLGDLLEATFEIVPRDVQNALVAAASSGVAAAVELKKEQAHKVVRTAAIAAGVAGAVPIPFSDSIALVAIQTGMLARISSVFGINVSRNFLGTLIRSLAPAGVTTYLGRSIVSNLLKFIPGAGSIASGAINVVAATGLTAALGKAYIAVLDSETSSSPDSRPSPEAIAQGLRRELPDQRIRTEGQ